MGGKKEIYRDVSRALQLGQFVALDGFLL